MNPGSARVLLVGGRSEDELLIRDLLSRVRGFPFSLDVRGCVDAALEALQSESFEVVLLDFDRADGRGLTTLMRMQSHVADLPVLVLVGTADEALGMEAVERGAIDYLLKEQLRIDVLAKALRYATERTHTLKALKASEARYRELYENVIAGVFQTTADGRFLSANPALVKLLGYDSEEELLAVDIARDVYMYSEDRANWQQAVEQKGEIRNAELVLKRRDGHKLVVLESSRVLRDESGSVLYYEGTLTDITEAHELSRQLSYEASHDSLTGLVNRREFELRLQSMLERSQVDGAGHAVCYLDLDQFKIINDTCGHIAGDELLRQLGVVLQRAIRASDTLARLGGDEFGVLLESCDLDHAVDVAKGLLKVIERFVFVWGNNTFTIGASVGLVPITSNYRRITEVLRDADAACYAAKDQGRNRIHVYQEDDSIVAARHGEMQWVSRAKRALEENRFHLEAQPIVPLRPSDEVYYELLVRLIDEKGRLVPPGAFLPAVERFNLATRLDCCVIENAFRWFTTQRGALQAISRCFINLSGDSLGDPQFLDAVETYFADTRMPPSKVCFEITETAAIANLTKANELILALRSLGCQFAMDDFGSGVSSFAYLKALPVDYVKIDGVFVGSVARDEVDRTMVKSINEIGHAMGKRTIAEAVEDEDVLEELRALGVDYAQGFALGRPQPLAQLFIPRRAEAR